MRRRPSAVSDDSRARRLAFAFLTSVVAHAGVGVGLRLTPVLPSLPPARTEPSHETQLVLLRPSDSTAEENPGAKPPPESASIPTPAELPATAPSRTADDAALPPVAANPVEVTMPVSVVASALEPVADPSRVELVATRWAAVIPTIEAGGNKDAPAGSLGSSDTGPQVGTGSPGLASGVHYRRNPRPAYPPDALAQRWEGVVLLRVDIAADGSPATLAVQASSGHASLDAAALAAVRVWEFEPARMGGQAVATTVEVPVRFFLASHLGR